jgi:hypothetical protein
MLALTRLPAVLRMLQIAGVGAPNRYALAEETLLSIRPATRLTKSKPTTECADVRLSRACFWFTSRYEPE